MKAVGKCHPLWVNFARLYERHNDLVNARIIFYEAVRVNYKTVDHLASVWCEGGDGIEAYEFQSTIGVDEASYSRAVNGGQTKR